MNYFLGRIVMLPQENVLTSYTDVVCIDKKDDSLVLLHKATSNELLTNNLEPQNLYLVSTRNLYHGNYALTKFHTKPHKLITELAVKMLSHYHNFKKVESTTDYSLGIPILPLEVVRRYVQLQGIVADVKFTIPSTQTESIVIGHPIREAEKKLVI